MPATLLGSAAEVLVASGHDPYVRGSLRRPLVRGWVGGGVTAWIGTGPEERVPYLSALGDPAAVAGLIGELLPELSVRQRVTLPRGTAALLPAWVALGPSGGDWDFRWLPTPPPEQSGEDRVVPDVDERAVARLLAVASPRAVSRPPSPVPCSRAAVTS